MNHFELTYKPFGEHSILIEWPQIIDEKILIDVLNFKKTISNYYIKEKVYIKIAYNSILISYTSTIKNIYDKISCLKDLYCTEINIIDSSYKLWKIPVCYDDDFGLDLNELSTSKGLSKAEIITLHSATNYLVYFIGFLPGFLYLGGLNKALHFPRRPIPRLKVKEGAVAIGGMQTGIYPSESPGGWNIIGNTPIRFFDVNKVIPCFAKAGDRIQFSPINKEEHARIEQLVNSGSYQMESEVIDD